MAVRERIPTDHPLIQRVAYGRGPLLLSLPFVVIGVLLGLIGLRVVEVDPASVHAPWGILTAIGAVFALAGLSLLVNALRGMLLRSRRKHLSRMHPERPWLGDWPWDARRGRDEPWRRVLAAWFGFTLFALFQVPFVWWAFLSGEGPWMVKGIVGLFLLICLLVGGTAFHRTMQALRYGSSYVVYEEFPFRLGSEARVRFGPCRFDRLTVDLECVEERFETRGHGKNRSTTNVMNRLHHEQRTLELAPSVPEVDLRFSLPDDPELTTAFVQLPIRYWRLRVRADVPGVDLDTSLLLPVYA